MKRCPKGKHIQPPEGFNANARSNDGLGSWCRDCLRLYRAENADNIRAKKAADYTTNKDSVRARHARYRAANVDRARERGAVYYAANVERVRATQAVYNKKNVKALTARKAAWAARNKDRVAVQRRSHYNADPSAQKARSNKWIASHPEAAAAKWARRRSRKKSATGAGVSAVQWQGVVRDALGLCAYCNRRARLTMDHVVPISQGGAHEVENVVAACLPCNSSKCDTPLIVWMARRAG